MKGTELDDALREDLIAIPPREHHGSDISPRPPGAAIASTAHGRRHRALKRAENALRAPFPPSRVFQGYDPFQEARRALHERKQLAPSM